jgi:hypothetical protein
VSFLAVVLSFSELRDHLWKEDLSTEVEMRAELIGK